MLHLLPEQHKKQVKLEYQKRLIIVACIFITAIAVIGVVALLPSYIYSHMKYNEIKSAKQSLDDALALQQGDKTADVVKEITDNIQALQPFGAAQSPTEVIHRIQAMAPGGIHITRFGYVLKADNTLTLELVGRADSRSDLTQFVRLLQADTYFEGARVPLSNFTKDKNIDFTLMLGVKGITASSTPQ